MSVRSRNKDCSRATEGDIIKTCREQNALPAQEGVDLAVALECSVALDAEQMSQISVFE